MRRKSKHCWRRSRGIAARSLPELVIAAVAERHRLVVLHHDSDFDLIATVTGQPVEWVVPRGSLP